MVNAPNPAPNPAPSPAPNPAPNPQRRSEKSRRAILTAALDLCAEHGYGGVTVEAIAARAGVSKKTIYRWWPSKGAVVLEATHDRATAPTTFPDTGDIVVDLRTQMHGVLELFADPRAGSAIFGIIAEMQHDPALAGGFVEQLVGPRLANARDRLRRARDAGQLAPDLDVDLTIELLYSPIYYRRLLFGSLPTPEHVDAIIERVVR